MYTQKDQQQWAKDIQNIHVRFEDIIESFYIDKKRTLLPRVQASPIFKYTSKKEL